jgi:transposase
MNDWRKVEDNDTWCAMQRVREIAELVVDGKKQMQAFCSIPGLGKTENVLSVMDAKGQKPRYSSPTNAAALCADLWSHRNSPYLLEDCDKLAQSAACASVAKMAWGPTRMVVVPQSLIVQRNERWRISADERYDPTIPPPTFRVGPKHGMIWTTNTNFTNPKVIREEMAADFAALVSRGLDPIWIPAESQDVLNYTLYMIVADGMLRRHRHMATGHGNDGGGGFKLVEQQDVLNFLCTHARRLKEVTPRMAVRLAQMRRTDPNWQRAFMGMLAPEIVHPRLILPDEPPKLTLLVRPHHQSEEGKPPTQDRVVRPDVPPVQSPDDPALPSSPQPSQLIPEPLATVHAPGPLTAPSARIVGPEKVFPRAATDSREAMPFPLISDALWSVVDPLLPPAAAKPKRGRPPVSARAALTGILFVLRMGIPWQMLPAEMGCGSGMTCWRRLRDWQAVGVWDRLHRELMHSLPDGNRMDWSRLSLDS